MFNFTTDVEAVKLIVKDSEGKSVDLYDKEYEKGNGEKKTFLSCFTSKTNDSKTAKKWTLKLDKSLASDEYSVYAVDSLGRTSDELGKIAF